MPVQNGTSNGAASQGVGGRNSAIDFDDIGISSGAPDAAAAQMTIMMDDSTDGDAGDGALRRPSRESLASEDNGKDNPAFEADEPVTPGTGNNKATAAAEKNLVGQGHPQQDVRPTLAKDANHRSHQGDVEMLPLNPAAHPNQQQKNNRITTPGAPVNGSATNHKEQNKNVLDSMYSDYFKPVNTRRKLLRGEKLYVTRDQRAHSRGWKWIAFWGGVFTFVAAALLTGILAATGIIMNKTEPSSHRIFVNTTAMGNETNLAESVDSNDMTVTSTESTLETTSVVDLQHFTKTVPPIQPETNDGHSPPTNDFGNSLELDNIATTTDKRISFGTHDEMVPPDWPPPVTSENEINSTATTTTTSTLPPPAIHETMSGITLTVGGETSTQGRQRSLDNPDAATADVDLGSPVIPDNTTLFPELGPGVWDIAESELTNLTTMDTSSTGNPSETDDVVTTDFSSTPAKSEFANESTIDNDTFPRTRVLNGSDHGMDGVTGEGAADHHPGDDIGVLEPNVGTSENRSLDDAETNDTLAEGAETTNDTIGGESSGVRQGKASSLTPELDQTHANGTDEFGSPSTLLDEQFSLDSTHPLPTNQTVHNHLDAAHETNDSAMSRESGFVSSGDLAENEGSSDTNSSNSDGHGHDATTENTSETLMNGTTESLTAHDLNETSPITEIDSPTEEEDPDKVGHITTDDMMTTEGFI